MPFGFNFNFFNNNNNVTNNKKRNVITFEEGLETLQEGIMKLFKILEGSEHDFTPKEHIKLYTYISIISTIYFIQTTFYYICSISSIIPILSLMQDCVQFVLSNV
jgi:hypothetical protein